MLLRIVSAATVVSSWLFLLVSVCYPEGSVSSTKAVEPAQPETTRVLQRVRSAVARNHLTKVVSQCLVFEVDDSPPTGMILVNVREKHDGTCGGDPATSPHLFSVRVSKKTNRMWSDAKSDTGEFEPLAR
jgi:hypothetical protein